MVELLYFTIRQSPEHWWFITWALFMGLFVVLAQLAPVVLFPIFYKFEPLDNEDLRRRLVVLSERAGTRVRGIYRWKLSEKSKKSLSGWRSSVRERGSRQNPIRRQGIFLPGPAGARCFSLSSPASPSCEKRGCSFYYFILAFSSSAASKVARSLHGILRPRVIWIHSSLPLPVPITTSPSSISSTAFFIACVRSSIL